MVRNKFTYLLNSYLYSLYDHSWSVGKSIGRRTSRKEDIEMSETTITLELIGKVQAIFTNEMNACLIWMKDHPDEDHANIILRVHLMASTYVQLNARKGSFTYPEIVSTCELIYNAFANRKEYMHYVTGSSELLESSGAEETQRSDRA